jgi:hypothetical protein
MPKFSIDKGCASSPNKDDCEPGLLITLEDDEEIQYALLSFDVKDLRGYLRAESEPLIHILIVVSFAPKL